VIELVGVNRSDEGDVVDDLREVREHLGKFRAGLAVSGELEARAEHGGIGSDEGVALAADDGRREWFAFESGELGFVVEEFELAGGTGHEQVDDPLRLWREVRLAREERGGRVDGGGEGAAGEAIGEKAGEGDLSEAHAASAEEMPPGDVEAMLL